MKEWNINNELRISKQHNVHSTCMYGQKWNQLVQKNGKIKHERAQFTFYTFKLIEIKNSRVNHVVANIVAHSMRKLVTMAVWRIHTNSWSKQAKSTESTNCFDVLLETACALSFISNFALASSIPTRPPFIELLDSNGWYSMVLKQ